MAAPAQQQAPLPEKINFAAEEEKTLQLWKELDAFKRSMELTKGKPEVGATARRRASHHPRKRGTH